MNNLVISKKRESIKIPNLSNNVENDFMLNILNSIPECMVLIDTDTRILFVNQAYSEKLNVPREKIIGQFLSEVEPNAKIVQAITNKKAFKSDFSHIHSLGIDVVADIDLLYADDELVGAVGFFHKVLDIMKLNNEFKQLNNLVQFLKTEFEKHDNLPLPFKKVITQNKKERELLQIAAKAAKTDVTLLITGESGVGKENLAEAIHESSNRAKAPFIKVNCAAIPETLLESELFGYESGSFTGARQGGKKGKFEMAHGGTLFLDEIGDMSLSMQAKLLRFIQQKEIEKVGCTSEIKIDVRIIAATNVNISEMISQGKFREDLYYRLNVVPLNVLPLRQKQEDILLLANHFLKLNEVRYKKSLILSSEVITHILNYSWPGNIRELKNSIEYASIICEDKYILIEHLPNNIVQNTENNKQRKNTKLKELITNTEKEAIQTALQLTGNNKSRAMKMLGISRAVFYQKLKKYNLEK